MMIKKSVLLKQQVLHLTLFKMYKGKDIILEDDVYTYNVNVREDSLQALLDVVAKNVVPYVVSKTKSYQ